MLAHFLELKEITHIPNCAIVVMLYVFCLMFVSLVAANCSIVAQQITFCVYIIVLFLFHYLCQPYIAL